MYIETEDIYIRDDASVSTMASPRLPIPSNFLEDSYHETNHQEQRRFNRFMKNSQKEEEGKIAI